MSSNWSRPFQLSFPLTAKQVEEIDSMFQKLFSKLPLNVERGGTGLGFGAIAVGDLLYGDVTATADPKLSTLASVTVGSYLRSGGLLTAPLWSTLKLPNTAAVGDILFASTLNSVTGLAIGAAGTVIRSNGTIPANSGFTIPNTFAQGDVPYATSTNVLAGLAKDTNATRYLSNKGTSNAPLWSQITLTNGVTGTLPVTNGGTGLAAIGEGSIIQGNAGVFIATALGAAGSYLRAASGIAIWSTLILPNAGTVGDLLRVSSTNNVTSLAIGTVGKVLRTDGTNPAWSTFTLPDTYAQGDILYASATSVFSALVKNTTATRYLSNTGGSNNPAWAQIDLTNGVTGDLPDANLSANVPLLNVANTFTVGPHMFVAAAADSVSIKSVARVADDAGTIAFYANDGTTLQGFFQATPGGANFGSQAGTPSSVILTSALCTITGAVVITSTVTKADALLARTTVAFTNGAGVLAGTLGNSPAVGNPTKWIPVDDNGTTRYVPAW